MKLINEMRKKKTVFNRTNSNWNLHRVSFSTLLIWRKRNIISLRFQLKSWIMKYNTWHPFARSLCWSKRKFLDRLRCHLKRTTNSISFVFILPAYCIEYFFFLLLLLHGYFSSTTFVAYGYSCIECRDYWVRSWPSIVCLWHYPNESLKMIK